MSVQFVTIRPGDEIAVMPRAEYEAMRAVVEDAGDAAHHARALADLRAGRDEGVTTEEMRRILALPSPVPFWRAKRRLTQAALAERAGVSQSYLAAIETGAKPGGLATMLKLAAALGLRVEDIAPVAVSDVPLGDEG